MEANDDRIIAAILSDYAYNDFIPMKRGLYIGNTEKFYLDVDNSNQDLWVWRTSDLPANMKVFVAYRGTSTINHVAKTWPIIATSLEGLENEYIPYFNHMSKKLKQTENVLKHNLLLPNYENVRFMGHSMGAVIARLATQTFTGSKGFTFNQGSGILTSPVTSKIMLSFLNNHLGQVVSLLAAKTIPIIGELLANGMLLLTKDSVKEMIKTYANSLTKPSNMQHHRQNYDLVSFLSSTNTNTTSYPSKSHPLAIIQNHEMKFLVDTIKTLTGSTLDVMFEDDDLVNDIVRDIEEQKGKQHSYTNRFLLKNPLQHPLTNRQIYGEESFFSTTSLLGASRHNFYYDLNSLNKH